ncbi:hypothetical protein LSTR_LSTR003807 [Laodelphax striatellus]|uniref:DUF4773 domain-containing protein n=1 Tax=Laodelphax striatellus TaxID=195883 RepID=A0A482XEM9_LAOST|nr:hypothetical protein LSTR_LSTR003807 [Laodelphax striatellus]
MFQKYSITIVVLILVSVDKSLEQDEVPSENNELTPANNQQNTPKPQTTVPIIVQTTVPPKPLITYPCSCGGGQCGCCTGNVLPIGQIACTNVTYDPDEFRFHLKMYFNERIVYQTSMSGQNPRPVCVPIRALNFKFCARMHNVYMVGRNVHACMSVDGTWRTTELFNYHFDCFRIGTEGVAFVKPEDGGGLPPPPPEDVLKPGEEDYDDTARRY